LTLWLGRAIVASVELTNRESPGVPKETEMSDDTITIRHAASSDRQALERLAGRDSSVLEDEDFVIAEVGDEAWAAIGLASGTLVADPFRPSGGVVELLRMRVERGDGGVVAEERPTPMPRGLVHRTA
jgi:hypothetical protein